MRPMHMRGIPILTAVLLLLGACGAPGGTAATLAERDVMGGWELVEGTVGGAAFPLPDGGRATLVVEDDQLGGTSFCNSYGGRYRLRDGALSVDGLGGTEMACEPELMAAEETYLGALVAADEQVRLQDGRLVLSGNDVELRFRKLPAVPEGEVVGTRWVLETVLRGDVESSAAGNPAFLELSDDGTFEGSTGCRALSGTWATFADEVVFPTMSADGECPDALLEQDDHVVAVLGDGFAVGVEGDLLTVSDADGSGLRYRAERP